LRKPMKILIYIFVFLFLGSCAANKEYNYWQATEYAKTDVDQAHRECVFEKNKSYMNSGMAKGSFLRAKNLDRQAKNVYLSCMGAKGWVEVDPPTEEEVARDQ